VNLAAALLALGLAPGDRLGIWAPNCSEWALTQFASAKAGLILVNLNPAYRAREMQFTLTQSGAAGLFCVVVPNLLTADLDLTEADLRLLTLEAMPLGEVIKEASAERKRRSR